MKRTFMLFAWLASGVVLSAQSSIPTAVEIDPKTDSAAFRSLPLPPDYELQLVTSNCLVWVRYDESKSGFSHAYDTFVYEQKAVGQTATRIIKFIGRRMPEVVGVSGRGSLLFDGGEEHIVAGDIAALTSQLFHSDIRSNCIYEVQTNIGPTEFMERLWMAKTGKKNAIFTIPVLNKNDPKSIREIQLGAVGVELHSGVPPSPKWIRNLWPIVAFDGSGFTIWNGSEWKKFKWDANNTPDGIRQPADGSPKPSS